VAVAQRLNALGLPTRLRVVGCQPQIPADARACVEVLGFLSKTVEEQRVRLEGLFAAAHFFILPVRHEAFGVVFAEASSFGLPSLAMNVCGVPDAVRDGVNGRCFAPESTPQQWAASIVGLMRDAQQYRALAQSSYREYQDRLSWESIGPRLRDLLERSC
jgi:glycosyltransferase involved in cell wall biosynthesis